MRYLCLDPVCFLNGFSLLDYDYRIWLEVAEYAPFEGHVTCFMEKKSYQ